MKRDSSGETHGAVSQEENRESGDESVARDERQSQQQRLDATHQSDTRGEHRYADLHQTRPEQEARQARDDLKQRMATPRRHP